MSIILSATHSRLAQPAEADFLGLKPPAGMRLSKHQVETYRALINSQPGEIVFNTALTGDGKSLAGFLPALREHARPKTLAMYPTKELIQDQQKNLERTSRQWQCDIVPSPLDADRLTQLQAQYDLARGAALSHEFRNRDVILTNPDIFHYVMQAFYTRGGPKGDAPDKIIMPMLEQFRQFTFDEFHIFQAPQIVSVTNALLFIREVMGKHCPRVLFLSATPGRLLLNYLARARMPHTVVQGEYAHGEGPFNKNDWRLILRRARLEIHPQRVDEWLDAHLDDTLLRFFVENKPNAKGAIIVNSIATAMQLTQKLTPIFAAHGLTVASNTGLNTPSERERAYDTDLLIGTSTVDVGVDFQINFLVFESRDAGTFLQRLGRLGRHDGYERDGKTHPFEKFEAHALVPRWVREQFFAAVDENPPRLRDGTEIDRSSFAALLPEVFPPVATFESYGRRWGGYQAAKIYTNLRNPTIRESYAQTAEHLREQYEKGLGISINFCAAKLKEWRQNSPALRNEVLSFRGESPFQCGVIDKNAQGMDRVKFYDLFPLIMNFNVEVMDIAKFMAEARRLGWAYEALERLDMVGAFYMDGVREIRMNVEVALGFDPQALGQDWFHRAKEIDQGVAVIAPAVNGIGRINTVLRRRRVVALLSPISALDLTRRLRLPMPFPIYPATRAGNGAGSIAFARHALLLETALAGRPDLAQKATGSVSALIA